MNQLRKEKNNIIITVNKSSASTQKKLGIFLTAAIILTLLSLIATKTKSYSSVNGANAYSYKKEVDLNDGLRLRSELNITSERELAKEDGLYCGFRFRKTYEFRAKLDLLSDSNALIDSANLTSPELVMPFPSDEYLYWYKPKDLDNDGKEQEFITAEYGNCSGNYVNFLKYDKNTSRIEKFPIILADLSETSRIYVDISPEALKIGNGIISAKYYQNSDQKNKPAGFYRSYYKFDKEKNKLVWFKEEKE